MGKGLKKKAQPKNNIWQKGGYVSGQRRRRCARKVPSYDGVSTRDFGILQQGKGRGERVREGEVGGTGSQGGPQG